MRPRRRALAAGATGALGFAWAAAGVRAQAGAHDGATVSLSSGPCAPPAPSARRPGDAAPRVGLALGSGSLHGIAHVGVLRALERAGLAIDCVAGTSAGAIAGALYAARLSSAQIERFARGFEWQGASVSWLLPFGSPRVNEGLQRRVADAIGGRDLDALPRRFAAVATDVVNGRRVVLTKGPAGRAVGASAAIPVMYAPVRIGGRDLVDGSLCEPVPVRAAREIGADFVIAIDVAYRPDEEPASGVTGVAFQTMHIMVNSLIRSQIGEADFALSMNLHHLMLGRGDVFDRLVEAGDAAMTRAWPALRARLAQGGHPFG